jgi:DNA-binding YbaB/EbfC family protein
VTPEDDSQEMGSFGLGDILSQVQDMQERLAAAQAEAADTVIEGRAGGGAVVVQITGAMEFRSIKIDPEFFSQGDVTLLEDMLLAAIRGAMESVSEVNRSAIEKTGFDDMAGFGDLDAALGGMLGGGPPPLGETGKPDEALGGGASAGD